MSHVRLAPRGSSAFSLGHIGSVLQPRASTMRYATAASSTWNPITAPISKPTAAASEPLLGKPPPVVSKPHGRLVAPFMSTPLTKPLHAPNPSLSKPVAIKKPLSSPPAMRATALRSKKPIAIKNKALSSSPAMRATALRPKKPIAIKKRIHVKKPPGARSVPSLSLKRPVGGVRATPRSKALPAAATRDLRDAARADYERIDSAGAAPSGFTFADTQTHEDDGTHVRRTSVRAPSGHSGWIERAWNPDTKTLEMRNAFLDKIPDEHRSVNVNGKSIKLSDLLTLRQMRSLGIEYGGIEHVKLSTIQNARTVARLAAAKRDNTPPQEAVAGSHSVRYAARVLKAAGHEIIPDSLTVKNGVRTPFERMLQHFETGGGGRPHDLKLAAEHDKILAAERVKRTDTVHWNFDIGMRLKPLTEQAARPRDERK